MLTGNLLIPEDNIQAYCKCEKCGEQAVVDTSMVYTSMPPKYSYKCEKCGHFSYINTRDVTIFSKSNNTQPNQCNESVNIETTRSLPSMLQTNMKISPCSQCLHATVCKYKESFEETWNKYNAYEKCDDVAVINVSCKHFYSANFLSNARLMEYGDLSTAISQKSEKSCAECDFYKNYLASGKSYIGDSPCQWCLNYPYKLTCQTSTTASVNRTPEKTILNESVTSNISLDKEIKNNV